MVLIIIASLSSAYASDSNNSTINYNNYNDIEHELIYENHSDYNQITTDEEISTLDETQEENKNTIGIIMSDDSYSCGAASFATVLNKIGKNISLSDSKIATKTSENGTTMFSIIEACKLYNLTGVGLNINVNNLKENYIVHMNINGINHWSVFKNITGNYIYLADPNLGNYKYDIDEFIEYYTNNSIAIFDNFEINCINNSIKIYLNNNLTNNIQKIHGFGYAYYKTVKISKISSKPLIYAAQSTFIVPKLGGNTIKIITKKLTTYKICCRIYFKVTYYTQPKYKGKAHIINYAVFFNLASKKGQTYTANLPTPGVRSYKFQWNIGRFP